jgi:hypothetical protein
MIVVRSAGRLGNQLFVFAAIAKIRKPDEKIVLFGFDELAQALPELLQEFRRIPMPRKHWWKWDLTEKILRPLKRAGVLSHIFAEPGSGKLARSRGLLPISQFDGGWCQDERLLHGPTITTMKELLLRKLASATESSEQRRRQKEAGNTYFVHIRRGDYLTWPSPESPAALPESWFRDAMARIRGMNPQAQFLVFSDDTHFAEGFSSSEGDASVITASEAESLAMMASCEGGILSPSSFSWWGAALASRESAGPFIAPTHWISWGNGSWDDSHHFQDTSFLTWVPVKLPTQ